MPNDVWIFKTYSNGKMEISGTRPAGTALAEPLSDDVLVDGHLLSVWRDTRLADVCRTCSATGLLKGQLCDVIDQHNAKVTT